MPGGLIPPRNNTGYLQAQVDMISIQKPARCATQKTLDTALFHRYLLAPLPGALWGSVSGPKTPGHGQQRPMETCRHSHKMSPVYINSCNLCQLRTKSHKGDHTAASTATGLRRRLYRLCYYRRPLNLLTAGPGQKPDEAICLEHSFWHPPSCGCGRSGYIPCSCCSCTMQSSSEASVPSYLASAQ